MSAAAHAAPAARSLWVQSPRWDALWLFSGLWAPVLAALAYVILRGDASRSAQLEFGAIIEGVALVYLPLSILHRITTTYAVLGTPILRDEVRKDRARYLYVPGLIVAGCVLLALAFAFHDAFAFMPSLHGRLWAFFLLAYVMYGWERWHFCAQEFGVLSIYRVRAGQSAAADKTFDRSFTIYLMLVVNIVLAFRAGFKELREVMLFGTPLASYQGAWLEPVASFALVSACLLTAVALLRELRHPQRSLPKLAFYVLVAAHTPLLYFFPKALGLFFLSSVFHHWMVSVGLFSRVTLHAFEAHPRPAGKPERSPRARLFFGVGPFVALALVFYLVCDQLDRAGNLAPVPSAMTFAGASVAAKVLAGVIIGLFFALNYLHFYYDRCFYAFSTPAVRKTVGVLLFRGPDHAGSAHSGSQPNWSRNPPVSVSSPTTLPRASSN